MLAAPNLFAHRPDRSVRPKAAPFLPMSRAEMDRLGWDQCDVIVVTGDAYIDHPSFGMAIIGRLLESQGLRVGIIAQPDWSSAEPFKILGKPRLFWGVTGGNMDSMVNHYTADRRLRHNDSYTPNDEGGKRPDRAVIVYSQRCREAFKDVPIVLGGIEASLRRIAQYDHWSEKIRRSVLVDSKADMLVYGNAERAIIEIAQRALKGESPKAMTDIRGTAIMRSSVPDGWTVVDSSSIDDPSAPVSPRAAGADRMVVRLPSFEQVTADKVLYAHASRVLHQESNPGNARALVQRHGDRDVWLNPPPIPLETNEMDGVYDLPYARAPHPSYGDARIPAWEMIRFSVNIMRGCFGGCSFCSITEHEGRIIQSRSEGSILREIEQIRDKTKGFTGVISDMGGPTANMYRLACKDKETESVCRRPSCVFPDICKNLNTDHSSLVQLYRKARAVPGVKKIHIASGLRYDLAVRNPEYVKELVTHHVGGYLKIAPEHTEPGPLAKMMKPGMGAYDEFKRMFDKAAKEAGKKLYLIPYFIAAHPGTTDEDMMNLALWLKRNGFKADQVQTFLPSPMSLATAMYHSERNPLRPVRRVGSEMVSSAKGLKQRRLHKAFLRYHDPENWPILREALKRMGREDLIGPGEEQLIPAWQPVGATATPREKGPKGKVFLTQQAGQGRRVVPPVGKAPGPKPAGAGGKPSGMKPRQTNLKGR
ncbi:putative radical SAM protein YgiQ [Azospirillum lipoferum]|uniref:YgiQ family radical SAM protein n=1 Tax=Azospirillum lipoferum TaxID=193 RepID=A0A5A9GMQ2_AZOLI|nr:MULTISPECIES: YgiQ family radical SAM protein [Azospirillum]KAA0595696.1 YgiQ family radical SAM protein [Azospirillum lipoferum]MCP1611440.1 putative radical SAM protein YgiQ [Azospirillum lipoferum]MDW5537242.1 YgiQ family radical SAM protein [Azospirillum sp. NL1]